MDVTVLKSTDDPEEVVCRAARGDYTKTDVFYNEQQRDEDDESDLYVRREEGEQTTWIENTVSYDEIMAGVEGTTIDEKEETLIEHLISSGHYGVFEHPQITFAIRDVSRVTLAQITRHRHLTFDVQSMRYTDFGEGGDVYIPPSLREDEHVSREDGLVDVDNREYWLEKFSNEAENLMELYEAMVEDGVPKEDARYLLPLGTCVNLTVSGNARAFMHLWNIRAKADAQHEIRQLTEQLKAELKTWMPKTYNIYEDKEPHKLSP